MRNGALLAKSVRSGNLSSNGGRFGVVGVNAYAWSSQASSVDTLSYDFRLNIDSVNPFNRNDRWSSFPLRCLAE